MTSSGVVVRQWIWLPCFIFLGMAALSLVRPWPNFPPPENSRIVTDAQGMKIAVPLPPRIVSSVGVGGFLETSHAPEALVHANKGEQEKYPLSLLGHIYPQIGTNTAIWNGPSDIESILARDHNYTYLTGVGDPRARELGLATLALCCGRPEHNVAIVRIEAAVLGNKERGEAIAADYLKSYADLRHDLEPQTLTHLPRVLPIGSFSDDWTLVWTFNGDEPANDETAGVINATYGFRDVGRDQEAERVLAMNPDIIFVYGDIKAFLHDPRWQGLKAVRSRNVYIGPGDFRGAHLIGWGLDFSPLVARWEAEIAHPERMKPDLRKAYREHFLKAYNYRLTDAQLDNLLRIDENRNSTGYARFLRNTASDSHLEPSDTEAR